MTAETTEKTAEQAAQGEPAIRRNRQGAGKGEKFQQGEQQHQSSDHRFDQGNLGRSAGYGVSPERLMAAEPVEQRCTDKGRQYRWHSKTHEGSYVGVFAEQDEFENVVEQVHHRRQGHCDFNGEKEGEGRHQQRTQAKAGKERQGTGKQGDGNDDNIIHAAYHTKTRGEYKVIACR